MKINLKKITLYIAWAQSIVATLGSLFFSEVMKLPPCTLCWYQRICMYPLVIIFTIGFWRKDKKVHLYALPLSLMGFLIATYHNWIISVAPNATFCTAGVSCTTIQIHWGFVTIPLLSLTAFTIINICMAVHLIKKQG